jgi:hypothetical protein
MTAESAHGLEGVLREWRSILASVNFAERGPVWVRMVSAVVGLAVENGASRAAATDILIDTGLTNGLGPQEELETIIVDAFVSADNEPTFFQEAPQKQYDGGNNGAAGKREYQQRQERHSTTPTKPKHSATIYIFPDPSSIPRREFLYAGHYVRNFVTATVAPGGFGKTTLTLFELLFMAEAGHRVWYISGEDPKVEIDRRIAAHCQYHNTDRMKIAKHLFVDDKVSFPLVIGSSPRTSRVTFEEQWLNRFESEIREKKIDVVALDPFISFHTVSESDNGAIDQIVKRCGLIAQNTASCMELSHHVRKSVQGMTGELTVDDTRGGSSIVNAVRSCRVINRMNSDEAGIAKISSDKRHSYVRIDKGKRNMAPPEKATWWHIVSVLLPNGDNVQAIETYEFPSAFAGMSIAEVDWVQRLLRDGGPRRASSQSEDWLGHEIGRRVGRDDTDTKAGAIWANKIISEWIRKKVFKKVPMRDPVTRKPNVPFYVANDDPGSAAAAPPIDLQERRERKEAGLRTVGMTTVDGMSLQIVGPEPDHACSRCNRREPQVYLVRDPAQGVESFPLHEKCAAAWFAARAREQDDE